MNHKLHNPHRAMKLLTIMLLLLLQTRQHQLRHKFRINLKLNKLLLLQKLMKIHRYNKNQLRSLLSKLLLQSKRFKKRILNLNHTTMKKKILTFQNFYPARHHDESLYALARHVHTTPECRSFRPRCGTSKAKRSFPASTGMDPQKYSLL